jgi:hypothetical protein
VLFTQVSGDNDEATLALTMARRYPSRHAILVHTQVPEDYASVVLFAGMEAGVQHGEDGKEESREALANEVWFLKRIVDFKP